jgi:hypothetical protein
MADRLQAILLDGFGTESKLQFMLNSMAGQYLTIITVLCRKYEFWAGATRARGIVANSGSMH